MRRTTMRKSSKCFISMTQQRELSHAQFLAHEIDLVHNFQLDSNDLLV